MLTHFHRIASVVGLAVAWFVLSSSLAKAQSDPANFTTVINSPPTIIGNNATIESDTQLNVTEGGWIGSFFAAGSSDESNENIEVNVFDGMVSDNFRAWSGSTINISGGKTYGHFRAFEDSVVNISGGSVGASFLALGGSTVNITGGTVEQLFSANAFSTVNISGGSIGFGFNANDSSSVNISGGQFGISFRARSGSSVNISGGIFSKWFNVGSAPRLVISDPFEPEPDSVTSASDAMSAENTLSFFDPDFDVNISGGVFAEGFFLHENGRLNLIGRDFALDNVPIDGLVRGIPNLITERDVTLSGVWADGLPFSFDLNSVFTNIEDYFHPGARLAVTLAVPEPSTLALLIVGALLAIGREHWRSSGGRN